MIMCRKCKMPFDRFYLEEKCPYCKSEEFEMLK
jgi:predicted Zn-ribbon and HTH transcriptional regulator